MPSSFTNVSFFFKRLYRYLNLRIFFVCLLNIYLLVIFKLCCQLWKIIFNPLITPITLPLETSPRITQLYNSLILSIFSFNDFLIENCVCMSTNNTIFFIFFFFFFVIFMFWSCSYNKLLFIIILNDFPSFFCIFNLKIFHRCTSQVSYSLSKLTRFYFIISSKYLRIGLFH